MKERDVQQREQDRITKATADAEAAAVLESPDAVDVSAADASSGSALDVESPGAGA